MKLFVFAAQCAGKTTLTSYIRSHSNQSVIEMEEEILKLNNGEWPKDSDFKENVLVPKILKNISKLSTVIFFENHMSVDRTHQLRKAGFKTVLIKVRRDKLLRRNKDRMSNSNYEDASIWIDGELENAAELRKQGMFDYELDGEKSIEELAKNLLDL